MLHNRVNMGILRAAHAIQGLRAWYGTLADDTLVSWAIRHGIRHHLVRTYGVS